MPLRGRERTNEGVPAGSYLISLLPKSDPADEVAAAAATTAMSREKGKHERTRKRRGHAQSRKLKVRKGFFDEPPLLPS